MRTPLYVTTPLIQGTPLDQTFLPGTDIYFKTESKQPSGSFKMRGISWRCQKVSSYENTFQDKILSNKLFCWDNTLNFCTLKPSHGSIHTVMFPACFPKIVQSNVGNMS